MKKTLAKILAIALCAVLLVTGTVYITLAYLLAESNVVHNTFTVSKNIIITLDEAIVDADGKAIDKENNRTGASSDALQSYTLIPGASYDKDPTVHVSNQSEDCFIVIAIYDTIFKKADGNDSGIQDPDSTKVYTQLEANGWKALPNCTIQDKYFEEGLMATWVTRNGETITAHNYTLYYYAGIENTSSNDTIVEGGENLVIFDGFALDGDVSFDTLKTFENTCFDVVAFGMQTSGYGNAFDTAGTEKQIHIAFTNTFGVDTTPTTEGGDTNTNN